MYAMRTKKPKKGFFMQGNCEFCVYWKTPPQDGYAICTHQSVGKRSRAELYDVNALLLRSDKPAEVEVFVGKNFGCIYFNDNRERKGMGKMHLQITPDDLRQILKRRGWRQADLARKLNVTPQRMSDWLSAKRKRKIPSMASAALEAMGLLE